MFTFIITSSEYRLLKGLDAEIMDGVDWIKKQDDSVCIHFKDFETFDSFMADLNDMEATLGMDDEQENLTPVGVKLQDLYDRAYNLEEDED
ncbi:hypothetical protein [Lactiplantibacillus songbeiensis]|uniref:Uncharacterized protein n=1 Tax=Lactiplantibacillus songbeiensis TaxID=2559920 RepID=A0ABW4BW88_9LACO|nr:hypothetical protein [Lactiplantibacillus songbeiensis]